jgi:xanthine/CO dehydrogenase XdhC/CoxF family maturation factor
MKELLDVIEAIEGLDATGDDYALATVVSVQGSTYRRPGARQLVMATGSSVGSVSGGCLDSEVRTAAQGVMADGDHRVATYDLTAEDDLVWGWGLGCSGITEVLFEPARTAHPLANSLGRALAEDTPIAIVTVIESNELDVGRRMVVSREAVEGSLGTGAWDDVATAAALAALDDDQSGPVALETSDGAARVFVEAILAPPALLVCGAGRDVVPVVAAASQLGWRPVVADSRDKFLNRERFPQAHGFAPGGPAALGEHLPLDGRTYVMLMSHNFLQDGDYLATLLGTEVAYLGLLGPRERADQLLKYAAEQGVDATPEDLAKIHGPAGLDIGAEGAEEIAWAIMTEVLAAHRGRKGGSLRERKGSIHDTDG